MKYIGVMRFKKNLEKILKSLEEAMHSNREIFKETEEVGGRPWKASLWMMLAMWLGKPPCLVASKIFSPFDVVFLVYLTLDFECALVVRFQFMILRSKDGLSNQKEIKQNTTSQPIYALFLSM